MSPSQNKELKVSTTEYQSDNIFTLVYMQGYIIKTIYILVTLENKNSM